MLMVPEIVVSLFAIAKVGGIFLPLFSGYGPDALATRLSDAGARMVFTADGARRKGRSVSMKTLVDEAAASVPTLEHVIVLKRVDIDVPWIAGRDHWWRALAENEAEVCETERTDADEPFMLIYTSGTTGRPKGAIHAHCGFPVKAAQDMAQGLDRREDDTMYWVTDMDG